MISLTKRISIFRSLFIAVFCCALGTTTISAQANDQSPPSAGDLREEQRQIGNAYLGDADFQLKRTRERLGVNNFRLAQQSGLWALEQLAYAKRRLEKHAPRIETAVGLFGRVTEGTRKDLRESYRVIRERYVEVEEKIEVVAEALKKAGWPILSNTLSEVRSGGDPDAAVSRGLQAAGESGQGDSMGGESAVGGPGGATGGGGTASVVGSGGDVQTVPGGVMHRGQKIPGTYDPATNTVTSPEFGTLQLGSVQTNAAGVSFYQTDKGVWMTPPGILIPGAKLNPDGTITFADGSTSSIDDVKVGPDGKVSNGRAAASMQWDGNGMPPKNSKILDQNGREITITRPFKDGVALEVEVKYLGAANTILQREEKIELRMVKTEGTNIRVQRTPIESRTWSLRIDFAGQPAQDGKLTGKLTVADAAGASGLTVESLEVESDDGQRPSLQKAGDGQTYSVTFTKSGDYTAIASGTTDWGSVFKIEAILPIGL